MQNNADHTRTTDEAERKKVTINTIQRTAFVERICINKDYPADRIIPYDIDNLYPNKIKSIAQRSGTTISAIGTLSSFVRGEGFQGMDTIVNRAQQTGWDLLRFVTNQKSMFKGFALHFNVNVFGQIMEIQPVPFEFVRWSRDCKKLVINTDWARRRRHRGHEKEYYPFDLEKVGEQIEEAKGLENYMGQIFYWIEDSQEIYTLCGWDSVIDDAQFEAEAKIYSLSNIQNDYSLSGIFNYPGFLEGNKEIEEVKKFLRKGQGSQNAGGIIALSANPSEEMRGWKWFTPITRNNIDTLHKDQKEEAKLNIYHQFRQPPILNGVSENGMFNQASYNDAFNYYNAQTETERKDLERELSKIFNASIFPVNDIQIIPKPDKINGTVTN